MENCCAQKIKKWLIIGFAILFIEIILGFSLMTDRLHRDIVHYYLNTTEVLEQIHNVTIDHGKVFKK